MKESRRIYYTLTGYALTLIAAAMLIAGVVITRTRFDVGLAWILSAAALQIFASVIILIAGSHKWH